uniref:5_nucleotid_C domain-containing protein n=1 Tax=Macrostomum lignano TaxID=282301 RepID=A0A1I8F9X5_9PLAT
MPNARQLAHSALQRRVTTSSQPAPSAAPPGSSRRCALSPSSNLWCSSPATCSARRPSARRYPRPSNLVQVLKPANIDAACFGNHDFDFGRGQSGACAAGDRISLWLLSNIIDRETGRPLAEGLETVCIDHRASGLRLAIVGLVELEWVDTLSTVDPEDIHPATLVIALTHMRWPNDRKLARRLTHIDINSGRSRITITCIEFVNNRAIVKSGTDFPPVQRGQPLYAISLRHSKSRYRLWTLTARNTAKIRKVAKAVESHVENLEKSMQQRVLGQVDCPLELPVRAHIRTQGDQHGKLHVTTSCSPAAGGLRGWSTPARVQTRLVQCPDCVTAGW